MASMTGRKDDQEKIRLQLIPAECIEAVGAVMTFGAKKYADDNWKQGMDHQRVYGAVLRHLMAWKRGEKTDPESGLSHLWHAATGLFFLIYYEIKGIGVTPSVVAEVASDSAATALSRSREAEKDALPSYADVIRDAKTYANIRAFGVENFVPGEVLREFINSKKMFLTFIRGDLDLFEFTDVANIFQREKGFYSRDGILTGFYLLDRI